MLMGIPHAHALKLGFLLFIHCALFELFDQPELKGLGTLPAPTVEDARQVAGWTQAFGTCGTRVSQLEGGGQLTTRAHVLW